MATKDEVLTENDDDIDVIEVDAAPGDEAKAAAEAAAAEAEKAKAGDDKDEGDEDDEHEEDSEQEDSRLADRDADPEERNEQEREKRLKRRQRQKAARDATLQELQNLRAELAQLRQGQHQLQTTQQSNTVAQIDARIAEVRRDIATADAVMAQALKDGNGEDFVTAQRLRDEARDQERELAAAKKASENRPAESATQVTSFAQQWMAANTWYHKDGSDTASAVVNAIDAGMMAEGFDPATRGYWSELTRRVRERMGNEQERPERRKENGVDKEEPPRRKAPPLGANRDGSGGQGGRRQVHLSKERVEAIKAAGAWDDPKERASLIKAYEEYDREHSAAAR